MRTYTHPTWRSQPAAHRPAARSFAGLVPLGYASTWVVLDRRPDTTAVGLAGVLVALAIVHRVVPSLVELGAGAAGLAASMFTVTEQRGCGDLLGGGGTTVVLGFAGVMSVSAFVRLLGTGNGREMARHLIAATAALGLCLLVLSPLGRGVVSPDDDLTTAIVLAGALLATTLIALRSRVGFPLLGAGLVTVQGLQALSGDPCALSPALSLLGLTTFTLTATLLTARQDVEEPFPVR